MEGILQAEQQGNLLLVEERITELLQKDPIHKEAIQRLIALRIRQGNISETITLLEKYIELYTETQAFVQLSEFLCLQNRFADAFEYVQQVLMMEPTNFYMWQYCGEIALKMGNEGEARKLFLTACKLSDYKYVRALKSATLLLSHVKESKTKSEKIMKHFEELMKEKDGEIEKEMDNLVN